MENYKNKSKNELIKEIESLERNINDLEKNKLKFRQAEEALRKSEVKYRLLADNSTDAIWQTDLKLIFTYVSPSIKKIFGYSVEEWVGSGLSNHASRKEFLKMAREALKAIKNYKKFKYITFESVMRKKDGTEIPVEITGKLLLNKKGLPVGLQGTTRDITKRLSAEQEGKQAEEALRKSEKQMHTLINTMPDFVCLKDGDGRWLKTNDAGIRIFQLEGIEYQGKNDSELAELNSKLQGAFLTCKESDARVRKEGGLIHGEEIIPYPDGSVRVFDVVKVSVSQTDDKQKGLVILGHDITERKHTEEELKKYREHLEELVKERTLEVEEKAKKIKESQKAMRYLLEDVNEAREELVESNIKIKETNKDLESFAYSVSHDLKSPLRAINGYTKVLLEDYPGLFTDEKKEFMDLIIKNTNKMNTLIDDLLRFSRAGRNELDISEFNMSEMVKDVLNTVKENYKNRNIESKIQEDIIINADIAAIKQVLYNLISNAVKFSKDNEIIKIEFGSKSVDGNNAYFIKDNGIGFDMKYIGKLFGVFQRLHGSEKYEGTGVGLALVKRIIKKHGGKIRAESEIGKGSVFYFTI